MIKPVTKKQRRSYLYRNKKQLLFDKELQRLIREVWLRYRHSRPKSRWLGDYYAEAFRDFLYRNRVPKQVPKVIRQSTKIYLSDLALWDLEAMSRIARKRQQPLSVIIEQAIREYCEKPENYLGYKEYKPGKVERFSLSS